MTTTNPPSTPPVRRLGKHPARHDPRTLKLSRYLPPSTVLKPPATAYYHQRVDSWPMYSNDTLGDCVCAAAGHMIEQWTAYGATPQITPTNDQVITAYEQIGGYVPGDPSTDNGCNMLNALTTWRKTGIAGHQIQAFTSVEITLAQLRLAIYLFGNAYIGVQLPLSVQDASRWTFKGFNCQGCAVGSWGGHCVPLVGFDAKTFMCVTWGGTLVMDNDFLLGYCDEAYAILTNDWIERNLDTAFNGVNINQLTNDLKLIPHVQ